jgi:hypothetical protein
MIKRLLTIALFIVSVLAAVSASRLDVYSFKLIEHKVYTIKTDLYVYQIYKNGEPLRVMNVYVTGGLNGSRILVDSDFNTSWNAYYFSKKRYFDNFWDSNRTEEYSVNSIDEAVDMAVDHYVQDRIAK